MLDPKIVKILAAFNITEANFDDWELPGNKFERLTAILDKNGYDPRFLVDMCRSEELDPYHPRKVPQMSWTPYLEDHISTWEDFVSAIGGHPPAKPRPTPKQKMKRMFEGQDLEEALGDASRSLQANIDIALRAIENLQNFVSQLPKGVRRTRMQMHINRAEDEIVSARGFMPAVQADVGGDLAIDTASGRKDANRAKEDRDTYGLAAESNNKIHLTKGQIGFLIQEAVKVKKTNK